MKEVEITIYGKVQGVTFRAFTKKRADKLELFGYVKNNKDGSVDVVAQGEEEKLEEFVEKLKKGPTFAEVREIEIDWHERLQDSFSEFTIEG